MKMPIPWASLAVLFILATVPTLPAAAPVDLAAPEAQVAVAERFQGHEGCFVLHDSRTGHVLRHNPQRCALPLPPCSTFKIPNSLIALELGVLCGADHVIPWDPEQDPKQDWWKGPVLGEWPRDHDLRSAMTNSVVWYYQEVARRIRAERMAAWLARFDYGNRDISGGIDRFWLCTSLLISADDQVAFLRRLQNGELGCSPRSTAIVGEIIERERGPGYVYRGKTGGGRLASGRRIGWLVGWVERGERRYTYALNLEGDRYDEILDARLRLPRAILSALGILPENPP